MSDSSNGPQQLGSVLNEVINSLGLRRKIDEARIVETWAMLAGPQINAVTDSARVKGNKLFVKVNSATWRQELHLRRESWRARLNEQLGDTHVEEIVFR